MRVKVAIEIEGLHSVCEATEATRPIDTTVEGTLRSLNNIHEKFHQSYFLYLLARPHKFIGVAFYMPTTGLLNAAIISEEREIEGSASRTLSNVSIGKTLSNDPLRDPTAEDRWLPLFEITGEGGITRLLPMAQLKQHLMHTHCKSVCIKLAGLQTIADDFEEEDVEAVYDMLFSGLIAEKTTVGVLDVVQDPYSADLSIRCFSAFKSVSHLKLSSRMDNLDPADFNEAFFVAAARRSVRTIEFVIVTDMASDVEIDLGSALAFGFAEPAAGVTRELTGAVCCKLGPAFFSQLCQKANEIDARQPIDIKYKIWGVFGDIVGFPPKYANCDARWTIDDREVIKNGVVVNIIRDGCVLRIEFTTSSVSATGST